MSADYEMGFSVREAQWHGLGEIFDEYPGREKAMHVAGHDYTVYEVQNPRINLPVELLTSIADQRVDANLPAVTGLTFDDGGDFKVDIPNVKALLAVYDDGHMEMLPSVPNKDFGIFQCKTAWDVVDALANTTNVRYETAFKLGDGTHAVLAWLDEPVQLPGDDSPTYPWINASWGFKPGMPLSARSTFIRTVCRNTQTLAETLGKRAGVDYTFRHTKHVNDRIGDVIDEASEAIRGTRAQFQEYVKYVTRLGKIQVTPSQREEFVREFIFPSDKQAALSERVLGNVEASRQKLRGIWNTPTMPEAHELTAYGLMLAGTEYLDHIRGWRNSSTYFGRSMLDHEGEKTKISKMINELIAA